MLPQYSVQETDHSNEYIKLGIGTEVKLLHEADLAVLLSIVFEVNTTWLPLTQVFGFGPGNVERVTDWNIQYIQTKTVIQGDSGLIFALDVERKFR